MQWLRRVRAFLSRQEAVEASEVNRAQQSLSGLPAHEMPQPLSLPPPECPSLGRENEALRSRYLAFI